MAYQPSALEALAKARAVGQRPEGFIVVSDSQIGSAWASRNRFFCVPAHQIGEDLEALAGLDVVVRTAAPNRLTELIQRLVLNARHVTVFDTRSNHSEFLSA